MDSMGMTKERSYLSVFNDPHKKAQNKNTAAAPSNVVNQTYEHNLCNSKITLVGTQTHDTSSNIYIYIAVKKKCQISHLTLTTKDIL